MLKIELLVANSIVNIFVCLHGPEYKLVTSDILQLVHCLAAQYMLLQVEMKSVSD